MLEQCAYYETGSTEAAFNLAVEELLVERMRPGDQGCFMLWQNAPSVIIGRHQNARSEVNLPELQRRGIALVRRLTGGGAVYHDLGNVNFTFVLPREEGKDPEVRELMQPLLSYLASFGVSAGMRGRNDLTLDGEDGSGGKFSGMAGRRIPGAFLLHGTLLYDVDLSVLEKVLLVDPEKYRSKGVASVRARVVNLRSFLPVSLETFIAGVRDAYGAKPAPLPEAVRLEARNLAARRYANPAWNIGESPPGDIVLKRRFPFGSLELRLATRKGSITGAFLNGDFLTPGSGDEIPVERLPEALIGLPADQPEAWGAAWRRFPMDRVFHGGPDTDDVANWLASPDPAA